MSLIQKSNGNIVSNAYIPTDVSALGGKGNGQSGTRCFSEAATMSRPDIRGSQSPIAVTPATRTPAEAVIRRCNKIPVPASRSASCSSCSSSRKKPGVETLEEEEALRVGFAPAARMQNSLGVSRQRNKISVTASESDSGSVPGSWRKRPHALTVEEDALRRILRQEINVAFQDLYGIVPCGMDGSGDGLPRPSLTEDKSSITSSLKQMPEKGTSADGKPVSERTAHSADCAVEMPGWLAEASRPTRLVTTTDLASMESFHGTWDLAKEWMVEHEARVFKRFIGLFHLEAVVDYISNYKEPPREGFIAKAVDSSWFELVCAAVIAANGAALWSRANWDIEHHEADADVPLEILLSEVFFLTFFGIELILKVFVHRISFFLDTSNVAWNCFDLILVLVSMVQMLRRLALGNPSGNLTFIRLLRFLRTAKVLRMFRLMRFFSELRLILSCIIGSLTSLFWSVVMMTLILYMFGLLFVQATSSHLMDSGGSIDDSINEGLRTCFGNVETAMLSLFQVCTGGNDWSYFFEALSPLARIHKALFLFFIAFSQIALLNILTGIFVENAMKCAEPDKDSRCLEKQRAHSADIEALTKLCATLDSDNTGIINIREFSKQVYTEGSALRMTFLELGLHTAEALQFFNLLKRHSGDEGVDIDSFVQGVLKLKGGATSLDMQAMQFQARLLMKTLKEVKADLKDVKAAQKARNTPLEEPMLVYRGLKL